MPDDSSFVCCKHRGLVVPCVALGDIVKAGELLALIHNVDRTATELHEYFANRDGMIIIKYVPTIINIGDNLNVIAEIVR
jgi:N-alpha-acetyl-L-2,4-diaminobutyrate deacetylase